MSKKDQTSNFPSETYRSPSGSYLTVQDEPTPMTDYYTAYPDDPLVTNVAKALSQVMHEYFTPISLHLSIVAAKAVLADLIPHIRREAKWEIVDQLSTLASEWEPMLHVEEIPVGDNYGAPVNLSLWIWIEDQGKLLINNPDTESAHAPEQEGE